MSKKFEYSQNYLEKFITSKTIVSDEQNPDTQKIKCGLER